MIRAAAKNHPDVAVIVDPEDYSKVISELDSGEISIETKKDLALKVFEHTAAYDALIAKYLRKQMNKPLLPETYTETFEKVQDLRYGENPHQKAAFYKEIGHFEGTLAEAETVAMERN